MRLRVWGALVLATGLSLVAGSGCSAFKGSFWPTVEHCAPSPAVLIGQVTQILENGGDYETALEQLALTEGKAAVLCAVEAFVNSLGSGSDEAPAIARGKAFLAAHGAGK